MWYLLTTGKRVKEKGRKRAPLTACDIPISCSVHPNPPVEIASQSWGYVRQYTCFQCELDYVHIIIQIDTRTPVQLSRWCMYILQLMPLSHLVAFNISTTMPISEVEKHHKHMQTSKESIPSSSLPFLPILLPIHLISSIQPYWDACMHINI